MESNELKGGHQKINKKCLDPFSRTTHPVDDPGRKGALPIRIFTFLATVVPAGVGFITLMGAGVGGVALVRVVALVHVVVLVRVDALLRVDALVALVRLDALLRVVLVVLVAMVGLGVVLRVQQVLQSPHRGNPWEWEWPKHWPRERR